MKDDRLYLIHIQECITRVEQYTEGGESAFLQSTLVQDAVLRNLQTLAESSQRLSSGLKGQCPEIDWRGMAGFRNVLVHDYLGVNVKRVWEVVQRHLPDLKVKLQPLLEGLEQPSTPAKKKSRRPTRRKRTGAGSKTKRPKKRKK